MINKSSFCIHKAAAATSEALFRKVRVGCGLSILNNALHLESSASAHTQQPVTFFMLHTETANAAIISACPDNSQKMFATLENSRSPQQDREKKGIRLGRFRLISPKFAETGGLGRLDPGLLEEEISPRSVRSAPWKGRGRRGGGGWRGLGDGGEGGGGWGCLLCALTPRQALPRRSRVSGYTTQIGEHFKPVRTLGFLGACASDQQNQGMQANGLTCLNYVTNPSQHALPDQKKKHPFLN